MKRALEDMPELEASMAKERAVQDVDNQETSLSAPSARLGKCEVCAAEEARYACPKCEVKTCCLRCVQIHKKELSCDGIRDRSKFIPLREMTKTDFMSDYYFLEECTRYVEQRKTDIIKHYTRYNKVLPSYLFKLRRAAAERQTTLRFLLPNFTRHKENTTCYNWPEKRIYWRVEWTFTNACNAKYSDARCAEDVPLHQLLDKYVHAENGVKGLEYYRSVGVFGLHVLLKAEGVKRSSTRFYALDCAKTLRDNLAGKTLVEYPCIYVSYEQQLTGYDVIHSDEDVAEETKQHEMQLDALHKENQQRHKFQRNDNTNHSVEHIDGDTKKLQQLLREKKQEERRRKREEFENTPNNYLFADEKMWQILSSSEDNGNETEEEK